jgi:hypothetical protein
MLYKTLSAAVYGIDANIIQVEVDCSGIKTDQDHFHTVGLPDAAVRESRDRVRARAEELWLRHSAHAHHHQPRASRYKERRLRLRLAHGLRHRWRLRRSHQERNSRLPVRGRVVA